MKDKDKLIKYVDITVLCIVGAINAVVAFLDFINFQNITPNYAFLAFTLLSAILFHFIVLAYSELDFLSKNQELSTKIDNATTKIIDSLNGVEIKLFDKIEDVDFYIAQRIKVATKSVYDLNWQDHLDKNPNPRNAVVREFTEGAIDESIKDFCAEKTAKTYREIFTFSNKKNVEKMEVHMTYGDKYNCSYYENIKTPKFPKIQFVIIDDEEVVFVSSEYRPNFCAIKDKRIVSIFNIYFEQAWEFSKEIKIGKIINQNVIDKIKKTYSTTKK